MAKAALVIMAAGIGSRFGGGIKQLEPVGPNGEIMLPVGEIEHRNDPLIVTDPLERVDATALLIAVQPAESAALIISLVQRGMLQINMV